MTPAANLLATPDEAEIREQATASVAGDLARHCRMQADQTAYAITMAEGRVASDPSAADPLPAMRARLEGWLTYEQALSQRAGSPTAGVRYEPGLRKHWQEQG